VVWQVIVLPASVYRSPAHLGRELLAGGFELFAQHGHLGGGVRRVLLLLLLHPLLQEHERVHWCVFNQILASC
jgi:hypothetical protein